MQIWICIYQIKIYISLVEWKIDLFRVEKMLLSVGLEPGTSRTVGGHFSTAPPSHTTNQDIYKFDDQTRRGLGDRVTCIEQSDLYRREAKPIGISFKYWNSSYLSWLTLEINLNINNYNQYK